MSALPPKSPATVAPFSDALGYRVLGFDKKSGDRLEMLRLRPQLASAPAFEAAVRERQRRLADFRHAAYARVRQIDRPAGQNAALAIVSNYADGQRLSELLRSAQSSAVPIELIVGMCLLQQMVTAVAQLHALGADLSHGSLNPERLVVTPAGRVVVTEYVAGAGLASLGLTPQQAWQDYRLALPSDGSEAFTQASDVYQLGYLGLTLVSGKSIYDRQYPPPFATLLNGAEEIGADGRTQPLHPAIVSWLTRALRLGGPFASAIEAQASLDEAIASAGLVATPDVVAELVTRAAGEPEPTEPATMISMTAPQAAVSAPVAGTPAAPELPAAKNAVETPWTPPGVAETPAPVARRDSGSHQAYLPPVVEPEAERPAAIDAPADLDLPMKAEGPAPSENDLPPAQAWTPKRDISREVKAARPSSSSNAQLGYDTDTHANGSEPAEKSGSSKAIVIGGGLAVLAAIAAVVVFVVKPFGGAAAPTTPPPVAVAATGTVSIDSTPRARVFIDETPKGTTPLRLDLSAGVHRVRVEADGGLTKTLEVNVVAGKEVSQVIELTKSTPDRATATAAAAAAAAAVAAAAPAAPNPGFMTVDAPEDLQILEDGRPLGSSASGKVALEPGSHLLEFRSDALGFQATRTVQVLPGKTVRVTIPLPEGGLSINATPWADVTVDGRALGETPIANVTLRAGTHEIVFRHPQHGELKQTVVVKAGENGRVTVNMAR
ncbi:MAG: PEGA domain-containing protein [Vicinamibacteraceae bacterium]